MADFAEVIGDPMAHSKSPLIHQHWLAALNIDGCYRATRLASGELAAFFADRRSDPAWRGCNVTAPHKQAVLPFLDRLDPEAAAVGAVNCIKREGGGLVGLNTDVDGVAAALDGLHLQGRRAVLIGAGGAARAALFLLLARAASDVVILARDPRGADALRGWSPSVRCGAMEDAAEAIAGAALIINATPMGMRHTAPMPRTIVEALNKAASGAMAFDMVYEPLQTPFLAAAAQAGLQTADGLRMLIGQARRGFELFFGAAPPSGDADLRRLLTAPAGGLASPAPSP